MKQERPDLERRRHPRSEVVATAVVFSTDHLHGTYLVQDLSAGGACLVGGIEAAPGTPLTILLQFPGKTGFSVNARVSRREGEGPASRTAVVFLDLSAEEEDTIHEAIVAALERERARLEATVLVVDHDGATRDALERDLRALGHEAVGVSTPLEALGWLERPGGRIETVLVNVASRPAQGLDVLEYVGANHPGIRRVVVADGHRVDLALRSGRAHGVLRKPWDAAQLAETMGGRPSDEPQ